MGDNPAPATATIYAYIVIEKPVLETSSLKLKALASNSGPNPTAIVATARRDQTCLLEEMVIRGNIHL